VAVTPTSGCAYIRISWTNAANQPICVTTEQVSSYIAYNAPPSPQNIVPFDGTGERTANLFDKNSAELTGYALSGNVFTPTAGTCHIDYKLPSGTYTLSCTNDKTLFIRNGKVDSGYITQKASSAASVRFTYNADVDGYLRISSFGATISDIVLVSGSTAPTSYIPYGWQIPLTCASQTTPLYLGEVSTVRRIKKLVLDGTENWVGNAKDNQREIYQAYISITDNPGTLVATNVVCSHLATRESASLTSMQEGIAMRSLSSGIICGFSYGVVGIVSTDSYTSATNKVKAYLASEYAAGTPVTVWYVLETPTEGIVNEPLYKIGDYADELTTTTPIPTAKGSNTLTVDTTVQPSEVSITYTAEG